MISLNCNSSAAALVFYLPGVCTHTDIKRKQRKTRVRNILKSPKKTQYLMNILYIPAMSRSVLSNSHPVPKSLSCSWIRCKLAGCPPDIHQMSTICALNVSSMSTECMPAICQIVRLMFARLSTECSPGNGGILALASVKT